MKYKNHLHPHRGHQKVHTFASYDDTWRKFQNFKRTEHLTADETLNVLFNNYRQSNVSERKAALLKIKKDIDCRIMDKIKRLNNL